MRKRFWKGLTTIEVGIILFIVLVICAVIVIRYPEFKCRIMQSEAKFSLNEVYAAQMHFHSQYAHYATLERLLLKEKRVKLLQKYYVLEDLTQPTKNSFSIVAIGRDKSMVAGEQWTINEFKDVKLVKKACRY
jgi:Tfp pilus assembly protein PilE